MRRLSTVDFGLQHFKLCLFVKAMKKLTRNLIEEDCSQCLKILSLYIVKMTKIDWQRFETFCLRENE